MQTIECLLKWSGVAGPLGFLPFYQKHWCTALKLISRISEADTNRRFSIRGNCSWLQHRSPRSSLHLASGQQRGRSAGTGTGPSAVESRVQTSCPWVPWLGPRNERCQEHTLQSSPAALGQRSSSSNFRKRCRWHWSSDSLSLAASEFLSKFVF